MKEKYNLIQELLQKSQELTGDNRLSLVGQGDFYGTNSAMRSTMNIKHHTQHLAIDNPEFPFVFNGSENVIGANSSFYFKTDRPYRVIKRIGKFNELMNGHPYFALYFLHCEADDSWRLIERQECENLSENFGFNYRNEYLDACEEGELIPPDTLLYSSTSYDDSMNVGIGMNGRILYGVDPDVQDDAIKISESFARKMVSNQVISKTIPVNENTIFVNLHGDDHEYRGLPNIGDVITDGILCATRQIKETRMFSDLRDSSLRSVNFSSDQIFYGEGEVVDINIYSNNPKLQLNRINKQLIQYHNDLKYFYSEVYRMCMRVIRSGSKSIDREVHHWLRRAKEYLDEEAKWDLNDNIFSNMMVQILLRKRSNLKIGMKITGRHGNKTVISKIVPDDEMPYLTNGTTVDRYGRVQPVGEKIVVDLITNPLALINRTIPMALFESSITFILAKTREKMSTMEVGEEAVKLMFDVIRRFNPTFTEAMEKVYKQLSPRQKEEFFHDTVDRWAGVQKDAFDPDTNLRDAILATYEQFGEFLQPYDVFVPKKKWVDAEHPNGRDIFIGKYHIGYQYILLLKQSGERGFSVRSAGAVSDEGLPEKSNDHKTGKQWSSDTAVRFGEYETPNFMLVTEPEDFALVTALYRSSMDGRRFMYEAILDEDGDYDIPMEFHSRTADIMQVYLKSLGVKMETIIGDTDTIGEPEDSETINCYTFRNNVIFCTAEEMYRVKKLAKLYKHYLKDHPMDITDFDEAWDYILENLPFKRKYLTDSVVKLFKNNLEVLTTGKYL